MTPAFDIRTIYQRALWRLRRLDSTYSIWQASRSRERSIVIGGLVIELDNLVIGTMRLYVQCIVRKHIRAGSLTISGISGRLSDSEFSWLILNVFEPNKLRALRKKGQKPGRRDEKSIRDPSEWITFLTTLGIATPNDFRNAMSLNLSFYNEIGVVRNFYAHRSKDTLARVAQKFPQLSYGIARHPDEIVTLAPVGIARAKYPQWSSEGKLFLSVAAGAP